MLKSIEVTGANRDIAIEKALQQLGVDRDDVSVEVLDNGKKGFLGIGATDAKIRVTFEVPDAPEMPSAREETVKPAPAPAPAAPKQADIPADDPRLTTPHLVKAAPKKTEETEKPEEKPQKPARRAPRERRNTGEGRAERAPIVPFIDPVPMAEDQIPPAAAEAVQFIEGLLARLQIEGKATVLAASEENHIRIDISGEDMGPVIGRRGDTLDAIQYLSSLVINKSSDQHLRLTIDTENYRAKRAESLERLARKMAVKVCKYHKSMTLEPMNPYERRIIHAALQDFRGVTTHSTGSDPGRRVVISPDGAARPPRRGAQTRPNEE